MKVPARSRTGLITQTSTLTNTFAKENSIHLLLASRPDLNFVFGHQLVNKSREVNRQTAIQRRNTTECRMVKIDLRKSEKNRGREMKSEFKEVNMIDCMESSESELNDEDLDLLKKDLNNKVCSQRAAILLKAVQEIPSPLIINKEKSKIDNATQTIDIHKNSLEDVRGSLRESTKALMLRIVERLNKDKNLLRTLIDLANPNKNSDDIEQLVKYQLTTNYFSKAVTRVDIEELDVLIKELKSEIEVPFTSNLSKYEALINKLKDYQTKELDSLVLKELKGCKKTLIEVNNQQLKENCLRVDELKIRKLAQMLITFRQRHLDKELEESREDLKELVDYYRDENRALKNELLSYFIAVHKQYKEVFERMSKDLDEKGNGYGDTIKRVFNEARERVIEYR